MKISIVIPAKNEKENLEPLIKEIHQAIFGLYDFEIVVVDDGSTDGTAQHLRHVQNTDNKHLHLIRLSQSVGQSTAIWTGVVQSSGNIIVTLDADGQNDPADIPLLLTQALLYPVGSDFCVTGYRTARKDTAWKRIQSKIANTIRRTILGDNTPDTGCGLKVFPKSTLLSLPYFDHMHRFLPALIQQRGGTIRVVPVNHRGRLHGQSKYSMLGRLGVGIIDIAGVLWLKKRNKLGDVIMESETACK